MKRLAGSTGYIAFRDFVPPTSAGDPTIAALPLVGHSEALPFDLRCCRDGSASRVAPADDLPIPALGSAEYRVLARSADPNKVFSAELLNNV